MEEILIKIKYDYQEFAELVYADNGVSFPVERLQISPNGEYYQNKASRARYKVAGSCQVNINAIGRGAYYLLEDDEGKVWLVSADGFEKNFVKV